jgi:hypothetical protein
MLTIEHEHIVLLIMLTMIDFNCMAVNGFLSKSFNIFQTFFLCIHCETENLSTLQQQNSVHRVHRKQTGEPRALSQRGNFNSPGGAKLVFF